MKNRRQSYQFIAALCCTITAFLSFGLFILVEEAFALAFLDLIVGFIWIISTAMAICLWFVVIVNKIRSVIGKERFSAFRCFAIADGILMAGTIAYAVYDIMTDTGFLAGIVGFFLLIIVVPILLLLLIGDIVAGYLYKKKHPQL
ncbi:MAG: hypothetical protein J6K58_14285 [Lachnospiraceae bacterium]|nr:hypothetical protein [Lachnospiraceae bacterium]